MARPRQVSNEQILGTMCECVLEHGPQVSLELVANKLGVTGPALLKRFGSREELMVEALRPRERPEFLQALEAGPGQEPLEAQLEGILVRFWEVIAEVMPRIVALRESGIPPDRVFDKRTAQRGHHALRRWLELAATQGLVDTSQNLDSVALAMVGALQARVMNAHITKQSFSLKAQRSFLKDLSRLFCRAITPSTTLQAAPPVTRSSPPNRNEA